MNKEEQKKFIIEVMNADDKDGLYKQQTAVEWFVDQLPIRIINMYQKEIDKAKAMEKEQIIECWDKAYAVGGANGSNDWVNECELTDNGEYYYNEKYNK